MSEFGVHLGVGKLRKVIMHRPGLEMRHLTPSNCQELLFDDVIWARKARLDQDAFFDFMRAEFGILVWRVHELLEDVVKDPEGRAYILDRKLVLNEVGVGGAVELRAWMDEMDPVKLVAYLIGSVAVAELPDDLRTHIEKAYGATEFVLPPLPNQLFARDSYCWINNGVIVNPMYWLARRKETLHLTAIYKYHSEFKWSDFNIWWGDPDVDWGSATLDGGDVMPVGKGVVLIGMGERTTYQAVSQVAAQLFKHNAAERIIAAKMSPDRASMHLDSVFTFCDRDLVTIYEPVVNTIQPISYYPGNEDGMVRSVIEEKGWIDTVLEALGLKELRVIPTGGDEFQQEREQWDDGNNVVALEPGVFVAYNHNEWSNARLRKAGFTGLEIDGSDLGRGRGGGHCKSCPVWRDPVY